MRGLEVTVTVGLFALTMSCDSCAPQRKSTADANVADSNAEGRLKSSDTSIDGTRGDSPIYRQDVPADAAIQDGSDASIAVPMDTGTTVDSGSQPVIVDAPIAPSTDTAYDDVAALDSSIEPPTIADAPIHVDAAVDARGNEAADAPNAPICQFTENKCYTISNRATKKVLDIVTQSPGSSDPLKQNDANGSTSQQWCLAQMDSGLYAVLNRQSRKCLGASVDSNGAPIEQAPCTCDNHQLWVLTASEEGSFCILNKATHRGMDVPDGNVDAGVSVQQYTVGGLGGPNQQWTLQPIGDAQPPIATPVSPFPNPSTPNMLVTRSRDIRNATTGSIVRLRGVNLGGWMMMEDFFCPYKNTGGPNGKNDEYSMRHKLTERFGQSQMQSLIDIWLDNWIKESDLDNIKNMGMNVVRVGFYWKYFLDDQYRWKTEPFGKLDWLLEECRKRDIYIILGLHGAPGCQNMADHCGQRDLNLLLKPEQGRAYRDKTVMIWERIAQEYAGKATIVGYDLLNEPEGYQDDQGVADIALQWDFYDRLLKAVRAIDREHMVFLGATWDWEALPHPALYDWNNVVYEFHYYNWPETSYYEPDNQKFYDGKIADHDRHRSLELPVLVGEMNGSVGAQPSDGNRWWVYAKEQYDLHGFNWTLWTYKAWHNPTWGLFNKNTDPAADISTDSYERIRALWANVATDSPNTELIRVFQPSYNPPPAQTPVCFRTFETSVDNKWLWPDSSGWTIQGSLSHGGAKALKFDASTDGNNSGFGIGPESSGWVFDLDPSNVLDRLTFWVYDEKGNNVRIKVQDTKSSTTGDIWTWDAKAKEWTPISLSFGFLSEYIDLHQMHTIEIGEYWAGTYYFDEFCATNGWP